MMYGFAPTSLNRDLVALQYGQYDLEKTATALLSMISCAFALAAMMVLGLAERAPLKKVRMKLMVAVVEGLVWWWVFVVGYRYVYAVSSRADGVGMWWG